MMKLVSIIVPVYNRSRKIIDCYNSIINQTYKNLEIIFVDDGSTDNTLEVMKKFSDERVVIISDSNNGPSAARRLGVKASHGEYISFVDSDDTIDKDFIYKLVRNLENNNSNISIGRLGVHCYGPLIKHITLKSRRLPKLIDLEHQKEYLPALTPGVVGKLFRRKILELKKVNFRANEDMVVMYPLYVKSRYISVCNDAVYHYHLAKSSQFKKYLLGYSFTNLLNTFEPLKYIYDEFERMGKLEDYFYEIEMLFIKNISERVWNIIDSVPDKIYRNKFISVTLDYLECFFPDWEKNPYYVRGYRLGEVSDIYHIRVAFEVISKIQRKKLYISLDEVYNRYRNVEKMYEKINK